MSGSVDITGAPANNKAVTVHAIETGGHWTSLAVGGGLIAKGAYTAFGTGGSYAAACYCIPFAGLVVGALAGGFISDKLGCDEKMVNWLGELQLAVPGPNPAVRGDKIAHSHAFAGAVGGLIAGAVIGAVVGLGVAAIIASGGLATPLVIGAAAGLSAGLSGGFIHSMISGAGAKMARICGEILTGSGDTFFNGRPAARVGDLVRCSRHPGPVYIVEGSETIFINGLPMARIGHKTSCGAVIQQGCRDIFADNTTALYGEMNEERSIWEQLAISGTELAMSLSGIRFRNSRLFRRACGDPIDPASGEYVESRTDLEYTGTLPFSLTRVYAGKENVNGLTGRKWFCNWSQRLAYHHEEPEATLEAADGEILLFSLGQGPELNSRHLKAPHYHLTGSRESARLFDSRTSQTLIFATSDDNPHIGRLTSIEDGNGNRVIFLYREDGHLSRIIHSDGVIFFVTTTADGSIEEVSKEGDSAPLVRYRYDESGALTDSWSLLGGEFHYSYTHEGWLRHWHDSGITSVDLKYDDEGRVVATRTPAGMYNDRFVYHRDELKTEYIDATGAVTTLWFDGNEQVLRERDPLGNMTVHEYDELERRTATTDALGRTTRFDYDAFGLLLSATDHAGRVTGYRYDNKGLLNRVEHADGRKSTWEFDQRNNLVSTTDPDGSTYRYSYDDRGNPVAETGPDGAVTRWEYDHGIRLSAQIDPLGNRTTMEEDAWGRLRSITNAAGNTTRFEYDPSPENPRADMSRIIHPDGGEECFTYDREGLPATHVAQEGQETRYSHGAFDLLRSITDARGYTTKLDYDGAARLKGITNAQGQKWSLSYDPAGNLAVETDWAGRQTRYVRDAIGRVISKRLPDGVEQRLTWDEQDRIAAVDTEKQRISYEYDNSDRLVRASTFGKENEERESDLQFVYDDKGWLAKEIQNGIDFEYAYDASGRCISRTSPTGATRYGFDKAGQLKGLESNGHSLDFTRDERGLETQRQYRAEDKKPLDAFTLKQSYDPCGRLKRQLAGRERQLSTHERLAEVSRRYRLDKSGRLIGISDNKRGSSSYHYDPRDQVTGIIRQTGLNKHVEERFSYDELLNLAESSGQSHRYRDGTVRAIGPTSYRYDVRGRVTEKRIERNGFRPKTWRYLWDDFDRLVETRTPDGAVWRYTYDAFGRRIRKECLKAGESGKQLSTYYFWQGATLIEEWETDPREDDSLLATTRWHFEPGTFNPVAKETRTVSGKEDTEANFHLIVTDHLGTPKEMFDADGECLWQADQELWGRTTVKPLKTRPDSHLPLVGCSLRFQNQWEDAETGLFYNLNRYYDPDSGQYLSPDPIGLEGGLRTHGYVHDPMQWVDPLGLCKNSIFKTGANITPRSVAVKYRIIGRGGRTFVTTPEAITKIIGKLPKGNRIRITNAQARQLENELGLIPKSLESRNILSIVRDIPKRTPASPISGNVIFKGGGNGLPGGGPEITIQGIPSAGGPGIRQIIVEVEP